ncbi:MAG: HD domain-containing protein [Leptospiraceae bacterium]
MTPFVSDHADYYPPSYLLDWMERYSHLPFDSTNLSGESLKYFRSHNPVAVFRLNPGQWEALSAVSLSEIDEFLESGESDSERKWVVSFPECKEDFHLRFLQEDSDFEFTVDLLRFDGNSWVGPDQARSDYLSGTLRPLSQGPFETSDTLRIPGIASLLDFDLDPAFRADLATAWSEEEAENLSRKFIRKCFQKIVCGARPSNGFLILDSLNALDWFLPDLAKGKGLTQNRYHKHDIFHHLIYACDAVDEPILKLRLAALLHDIGKSDTRREQPGGEATFHNHEVVGARITEKIMRRFGFDANLGKRVKFLVRNHMFHYTSEWSDRAVRRFMQKVSPSQLEDLIALRLADRKGSGKKQALPRAIKDLIRHIEEIRKQEEELKVRDLKIDGKDLMEMGMAPGPGMGDLLKGLLDRVKSGELDNERDALLEAARLELAESIA